MLRRFMHKLTSASTGTPSDGLGGGDGSESSASIIANFHAAARQQNSEKSGADWELDEIIVNNEPEEAEDSDSQHKPAFTTATGSEKGTVSQTGSLKRNFDRRDSGNSESGYSSWVRGHLWPYVVTFFNPHFEEPCAYRVCIPRIAVRLTLRSAREMDYQKQEWVRLLVHMSTSER